MEAVMNRASINPSPRKRAMWWGARMLAAMALLPFLNGAGLAQTGQFDSGSNGSDGPLNITTSMVFDPRNFNPPLDADGDNVYNFTTITIASGVTVRMLGPQLNMKPVFWLASGAVQIDGTIDLSGADGYNATGVPADRVPAVPGAGGYGGGIGGGAISPAQPGSGPGGGVDGNS